MRSIAITGVSGYLGSVLLSRLVELPEVETIVGVDIKSPRFIPSKLKFFCQDIFAPLGQIFIENKVDTAIHLAFVLRPTRDQAGAKQVDVGGVLTFLDACRQAEVKHVLYLSSHTVYGAHPDNPPALTEESPLRPLRGFQYSADKAEADRILRDFASTNRDICITILRTCPVIGPDAANSVATVMFKPSIMIGVAGYDPPMQFVHEDDVARLVITCLKERKAGVFNVAGDGYLHYSEVARIAGKRMVKLPGWLLGGMMRFSWALYLQNESPVSGLEFIKYPPIVSTEKLKKEMGFQFKYSSRDALASYFSARDAR